MTAVGSVIVAAAQSVAKVYVIGAIGWLAVKCKYTSSYEYEYL
jgi:hypothetical protein